MLCNAVHDDNEHDESSVAIIVTKINSIKLHNCTKMKNTQK